MALTLNNKIYRPDLPFLPECMCTVTQSNVLYHRYYEHCSGSGTNWTTHYVDVNPNDHYSYLYNNNSTVAGTGAVVCKGGNNLLPFTTTEPYYRNDFADILIIFFLLAFICFWLPWKMIICRLIKRWN